MKTLSFGIIGTGSIAPVHVAAINSIKEATLVAVTDGDCEQADSFAKRYNVECESDYRDLCARPDIDIVTICAPHYLHAPIAIEAMKAGKHVICEKPMACTPEECDEMIAAAKISEVVLGVIFQNRFDRLPLKIRTALKEERLGRILWSSTITPWYRDGAYYEQASWRGKWATAGGGALINQAIHGLDLLLWLGGMPCRVTAKMRTLNHKIEVEDNIVAILEYSTGHLGLVEASTNAYPGLGEKIEFHGTRGSVVFYKGDARLQWRLRDPNEEWDDTTEVSNAAASPMAISSAGHAAQFQDFAAAVRTGQQPAINAEEGRRSIDLIAAIYRSARSGVSEQVSIPTPS